MLGAGRGVLSGAAEPCRGAVPRPRAPIKSSAAPRVPSPLLPMLRSTPRVPRGPAPRNPPGPGTPPAPGPAGAGGAARTAGDPPGALPSRAAPRSRGAATCGHDASPSPSTPASASLSSWRGARSWPGVTRSLGRGCPTVSWPCPSVTALLLHIRGFLCLFLTKRGKTLDERRSEPAVRLVVMRARPAPVRSQRRG